MVADPASNQGLRERKKRRTRATLVDVASELCFRQGYDNTTVEQIAAAADVSPRTFSRIAVLIQIVNTSQTLSTSPMPVKQSMTSSATTLVIAERMGLEWDNPAVKLVADTWTAMYAASIVGLGLPGNDPIDAEILCTRLWQTYQVFARLRSPWKERGRARG